jgi:hypothetical protein
MLIVLVALGLLLLTLGGAYAKRNDPSWRPLLPGIVGTGAGVLISAAAYMWLFDDSACGGRGDFACMLNANQGVLTALAALLTAVGLWGAALNRHADRQREQRLARERADVAIHGALAEAAHNLIHVALAYEPETQRLAYMPQLSVSETERLCAHEFRTQIHPELVRRGQNLERNYERMLIGDDPGETEAALQGFVNTSVRLLLEAAFHHAQAAAAVVEQPGFQDIRRRAEGRNYIAFRSSEAERVAPRLRAEETPVLCWFDDAAPHGVVVYPQFDRFRDMNHPPH